MAKKPVRLSVEELELITKLREQKVDVAGLVAPEATAPEATPVSTATAGQSDARSEATKELAAALTQAILATKGPEKKTVATRKSGAPWMPKNGEPRAKMNRVFLQHGIEIDKVTNEQIELLNKLRPGVFCEGVVTVRLTRDRALNIDYGISTSAQRLRLLNQFGIRNFTDLLERLVDESRNPTKYRRAADADLFDNNLS
jgi:hypothetical protein